MHAVYLDSLVAGLVATVLFAVLGAVGGAGHGAPHLHTGTGHTLAHGPAHGGHRSTSGGTHGHGAGGAAGHVPSLTMIVGFTLAWFNPLTLAAAALWFGGVGLLAESALPGALAVAILPVAVVAALLGAAVVRMVIAAFARASTPPLREGATGALGTISAPIRADAVGEVIYTLEGLRRSAAARSLDGQALSRGTQVVIVRRERGIAWVSPLDPFASLPPAGGPSTSTGDGGGHGDLSPPP